MTNNVEIVQLPIGLVAVYHLRPSKKVPQKRSQPVTHTTTDTTEELPPS